MAYPYYSSGGQGDPSGYKRNMDYSYDGGSGGYLSRISSGGASPSYRPAPVPEMGRYAPNFQSDGVTANDPYMRAMNANNYTYDMKVGPMQAQADLADRSATNQHNMTMEELRMKLEAQRRSEEMQMQMQREGWGNNRYDMRYGHLLKYGE